MVVKELGPAVLGVAWTFVTISLAVVIARMYIRTKIIRKTSIDDYLIIFTLLLAICNSAFLSVSSHWGLGQHIQELQANPEHIMYTVKFVYLCEFFSIMCPCFGRISFAMMLLSLVPPTKPRRLFLQVIIVASFVFDLGTVIISFSQCTPIRAFWDNSLPHNCWRKEVQQYTGFFQGSWGSAVDLCLAVFPASLFWNLKMAWKQKLALSSMMGLGVFAMIASIFKTVQLQAITATEDLTYEMAKLAVGWTLEANFVLIAASIPTLRPILKNKKASTKNVSNRENKPFESWHRGKSAAGSSTDHPFTSLSDDSNSNDTTVVSDTQPNSPQERGCPLMDIPRKQISNEGEPGVIQKDITVSVSYSNRV